jgi:3-hydroxyacyl-CoA dehydrogenase
VIEAVFEDLTLKHRVLQEVEANTSDSCIFASNTSALPISKIASVSKRPENVVGMHYFSPVHKMPLLEVIVTDQTSDAAAAIAVDVGIRQGKTVIVVKDGPGFYTTRILAPFMDEAALLCQEGIAFHTLDSIMQRFGYPVGPITLMDEVGLDVALHVAEDLKAALGTRVSSQDPAALQELLAQKCLGRKSGKGFYLYETPSLWKKLVCRKKGKSENPLAVQALQKKRRGEAPKDTDQVAARMTLRMVNEAVYCLQEGILSRPVDGDIGAVFGLGFPPIHGGPFRYLDTMGISKAVDQLNRLRDQYGARFEPAPLLVEMGQSGKGFYSV